MYLLNQEPLPGVTGTVDWDEIQPTPLELLAARGVAEIDTRDKGAWGVVAAVLPDLFATAAAARMAVNRSRAQTPIYIPPIGVCAREEWAHARVKVPRGRYSVPARVDRAKLAQLRGRLEIELLNPEPAEKAEAPRAEAPRTLEI